MDPFQHNIYQVTDDVYRLFTEEGGYDKERICHLSNDLERNPDGNPFTQDVDAYATKEDLRTAITDWATNRVGPNQAFTLYLMDHGGYVKFYLDGRNDTVSPGELDGWLGELEDARPGVRVNVIIEACHSGSFIDQLGAEGRVVIASTASDAVAYATDAGAMFSDVFVRVFEQEMSLYSSYEEARGTVETAHPDQSPKLDDDGDGQPNDPDDGLEAARRGFTNAGTLPGEENWPPHVVWATISLSSTVEVELKPGEGLLEAEVQDDTRVFDVWAVVYKPSYVLPDPTQTEELVEEHLPTVKLLDLDSDDVYTAIYESFNEPGRCRIVIHAVNNDEVLGQPRVLEMQVGIVWRKVYLPLMLRGD